LAGVLKEPLRVFQEDYVPRGTVYARQRERQESWKRMREYFEGMGKQYDSE
jgi:hypothetical protein